MADPLHHQAGFLDTIEETPNSHVMTSEHDDSEDEWLTHRLALAQREEETHTTLLPEHMETGDRDEDDDHQPFVYPGVGASAVPGSEFAVSVSTSREGNREQVTSLEIPEEPSAQTQFQSPQLRQQNLLVVENGPPCESSSSGILSEASPPLQTSLQAPALTLPSPAQLESLYAAASSGDLPLLKRLFRSAVESNDVQQFSLANDASTRTGYTALHASAIVEECGAMPDLEDREGETALHKVALNGHMPIVSYLLPSKADVHARDADGWTALHNACSKGYLDIVKYLCEKGGASTPVDSVPGVDVRSKDGWTPLMNAASKGHLPVVLYLLTKQDANPLIRNNWGETAYDAAAAVFEVWICEVLQQAEAERWRGTTTPYNPLLVHTTLPIILYENQRLDLRLKTVATSGGRPKFSASGLGKRGRRPPFELKLPRPDEETGIRLIPASKNGVQLPFRDAYWDIPRPVNIDRPNTDNTERSHFWLSDWTLDVTDPGVDADEGWQYSQSFDEPDDRWSGERPPQLDRILNGSGVVAAGFGGSSSRNASLSSPIPGRSVPIWVRRRRWVRIMRRRLDIPPLPYLEPDGSMYHLDSDGTLIPYIEESRELNESEGQELGAMSSSFFSSAQDYVGRARYLAGNSPCDGESDTMTSMEARRAIAKLERATEELRSGILSDEDPERRRQAEVLLNAYSRELKRRRLAADGDQHIDEDTSSEEEFHYPFAMAEDRRSLSRMSIQTDHSRPGVSRGPTDLTPQLSQAPEFRVPTREAPQKVITPHWTLPTPQTLTTQWERDDQHLGKSQWVLRARNGLSNRNGSAIERIVVDQERLTVPGGLTRRQSSSQLSDLADCPVCNQNLDEVGDAVEQEEHVRQCLEGGPGQDLPTSRYLVYRLPAESALLGVECVICLDEFVKGMLFFSLPSIFVINTTL
ncbi:hypothetical protein AGABI1DRAFT_91442 [Agaricus bisporus var. burnettii JB137-S8]|uniref:Uncharacterized protein n=1 Tax=Agaricus bisporus var. burnettii (strain JB137-S8 / ATCC MYA-4627 / FGSC 10392) TaxID=597362 RepID=K5WXG8_AGABU|nr:uncharacterized protein AGABI1DRAFT_91442 [Agaricus bisporus var. burnettii JB137-S8]EKM80171.1 hypothetical protein AGABI1DRAFT_91442 [Agaricus bisporus var. burnettii JB137-S8]